MRSMAAMMSPKHFARRLEDIHAILAYRARQSAGANRTDSNVYFHVAEFFIEQRLHAAEIEKIEMCVFSGCNKNVDVAGFTRPIARDGAEDRDVGNTARVQLGPKRG